MWLIDTKTLKLVQTFDIGRQRGERYAILSHTWGRGEVLFQDMPDLDTARTKDGWAKIEKTCKIASHKFRYAWVDTCCIDKTSSSELSEAINSMFAWYRHSAVCYVYLEDLAPIKSPGDTTQIREKDRMSYLKEHLSGCRWFTRGWTLQELVASPVVEFFDRDWNFVGAKTDLEDMLSGITKVDKYVLEDSSRLHTVPIARKMSWAAQRVTTRVEDTAYCLLGIFDVNMPLLYGEGHKAFQRLQEHLANQSNDMSLFAWRCGPDQGNDRKHLREKKDDHVHVFSGLFAEGPQNFQHCGGLKRHHDRYQPKSQFTATNSGVQMTAVLYDMRDAGVRDYCTQFGPENTDFLLELDCMDWSALTNNEQCWLSIGLARVGNSFVRSHPDRMGMSLSRIHRVGHGESTSFFLLQSLHHEEIQRIEEFSKAKLMIRFDSSLFESISRWDVVAQSGCFTKNPKRPDREVIFDGYGRDNLLGAVILDLKAPFKVDKEMRSKLSCVLICGLQWNGLECEPWVCITLWDTLFESQPRRGNSRSLLEWIRSKAAAIGIAGQAGLQDDKLLAEIQDKMLCMYSDFSGLLDPELMPNRCFQQFHSLKRGSGRTMTILTSRLPDGAGLNETSEKSTKQKSYRLSASVDWDGDLL